MDWALAIEEDPAFLGKVLQVLELLNDYARISIETSHREYFRRGMRGGDYYFTPEMAVPLGRLKGFSRNLLETQNLVEKVVETAIENEIGTDDMEELVDWALKGKDPALWPEAHMPRA